MGFQPRGTSILGVTHHTPPPPNRNGKRLNPQPVPSLSIAPAIVADRKVNLRLGQPVGDCSATCLACCWQRDTNVVLLACSELFCLHCECGLLSFAGMDGQVGQAGYTPAVSHRTQSRTITPVSEGMMIVLRQCTFQRDVLSKEGVHLPGLTQLVMLENYLKQNKALYATMSDLRVTQPYQYFNRSPARLFEAFNLLVVKGYMTKSSRDVYKGHGKVLMWGLTGAGRKLLATYYAYLMGEYDDTI